MKLFGGKKSEDKQSAQQPAEADDFDSPQENISFNQAAAQASQQRQAPAPQHVERDSATHMADVRLALHGGTTQVHRSTARDQWREVAQGPRVGVKEAQCHGVRS